MNYKKEGGRCQSTQTIEELWPRKQKPTGVGACRKIKKKKYIGKSKKIIKLKVRFVLWVRID